MSFLMRPTQEFRVPVISTSNRRLRIPSLINTTNFVLFLLALVYWAHFGNFLALEFDVGETYTSFHWWKIWVSAVKIFNVAFVGYVLGQLRTQSSTGILTVAMIFTGLFAIYDIICSIVYAALTRSVCNDPVCYLNAGVTPIDFFLDDDDDSNDIRTPQPTALQFDLLLGFTIGEALLEILLGLLLSRLQTNIAERMDIEDSVDSAQDLLGEPATVRSGFAGLTQPGFGAGQLVNQFAAPNQQPISQLSPAAQQGFVGREEQQSLLATEAARQSLADLLSKTQNLTNLATTIELVFFLLSLLYVGFLGNFLALEFDANEPYSSFKWWMLWIHGAKVFYLAFGFFTMGRAILSRRTIFFTVLMVISLVLFVWELVTFIVLFGDFTSCATRTCYGESGNTGEPGIKTLAYWLTIVGTGITGVLDLVVAGAILVLVRQVRARNTSVFLNESSSRFGSGDRIARRLVRQFNVSFQNTIGSSLDDDDAAASESSGAAVKDDLFYIPEDDPRHADYAAREQRKAREAQARAVRERNSVQFLDVDDDASESSPLLVGEQHLPLDRSTNSSASARRAKKKSSTLQAWLGNASSQPKIE